MAEWTVPGAQPTRIRRSTRVLQAVPLTVAGLDAAGNRFEESTATLSFNCHGCRYFSRYRVDNNAWLTLEIPRAQRGWEPLHVRARVAWVQPSQRLRGLYQVGVEFEAPRDAWGLQNPPEDWKKFAPAAAADPTAFEREWKRLLALAQTGTYYQLLAVSADAPRDEIRRRFYALARTFHPDRHMERPELAASLHQLMDALTQAYKVLGDDAARKKYDRRLAQSGTFALGVEKSEPQRTAGQCLEKARECLAVQNFAGSILWLRKAVELEPASAKYRGLLARSLAAVPQYRHEAAEQFEKALQLDPWNAFAHFHYARLLEEMRLPWRARAHYRAVLEADPAHAEARERLELLEAEETRQKSEETTLLGRLRGRLSRQSRT